VTDNINVISYKCFVITNELDLNKIEYEPFYSELVAMIIAKSTALERIEFSLEPILDKLDSIIERLEKGKLHIGEKELAENIVNYMQKAKLRINTKKFVSSISHMARFQYNAIKSFSIFERNYTLNRNTNSKSFYSILCHYYEIDDRNSILESKIDQINRLISSHTTLSYNREEIRLLLFECVLLAMFSLPHLVDFKAFFR